MKLLIVGLGLIGGSLLKALQNKGYDLYGYDTDTKLVDYCYDKKMIVSKEMYLEADLIFVCLYPEATIEFIKRHELRFKSGAVITDVSGLKMPIMEGLKNLRKDIYFIGGHPMAGKEGVGFYASSETIFHDANYLLTSEGVPEAPMNVLKKIICQLGCKHIEVLSPDYHDEIIAYTSHMPHIISTAFMNCDRFTETKHCVAGSFKDMTRVAEINADLWTELIVENKEPILHEIAYFKAQVEKLENHIKSHNLSGIRTFLKEAHFKKVSL